MDFLRCHATPFWDTLGAMRPRSARFAVVPFALVLGSSAAWAQQAPAKADAPKATATSGPTKKEARKDPEGRRGISPYMEQISKGEASFLARDFPGAISAFQEAIKLDTDKMLGFYRLGEAMLQAGKLEDAEAAWQTALGKKGTEDLHARLLMVLADLKERTKKWPPAKEGWAAYAAFLQNHPKASGFPATAIERQKVIDKRVKDEADFAEVKTRIAKRQAEKEAEALENAKKDKLNR
jgi:tetratricopeptide (TPR) repeat protein